MDRGVSEIVSSVIMILLVSAIGIGIFLYGAGYFSGITSARQEATSMDIQGVKENFVIVDAMITNASTSTANLAIYNYGTVKVELAAMYINGIKFDVAGKVGIEPYEWAWFNGTYPGIIQGTYCFAKAVSTRGNSCEGIFAAEGG